MSYKNTLTGTFGVDNYSNGYYNASVASTCSSISIFAGTYIVVLVCVLVNDYEGKEVLFRELFQIY